MASRSPLEEARAGYSPKLPPILAQNGPFVTLEGSAPTEAAGDSAAIRERFPLNYGKPVVVFAPGAKRAVSPLSVGVVLSGGQAPGGHNVIAGLGDGIRALHSDSRLIGFLGGPAGLVEKRTRLLTGAVLDAYRNTGGFDIIGSGRTKLETDEQFARAVAN